MVRCMRRWAAAIEEAALWCSENADTALTPEGMEAAAQAECVFVGTDIRNVLGTMFRSGAIAAVERLCLALARLLASSWAQGTVLGARAGPKQWACRRSFRGGAQGRLSTHVASCAHLHEVMGSVRGLQPPEVVRVGIIDDQYLVGPLATIASLPRGPS